MPTSDFLFADRAQAAKDGESSSIRALAYVGRRSAGLEITVDQPEGATHFKFKVGQLVLATESAAYINRGPTYIVLEVFPGFYTPTDPMNERPYRIRQLSGEPITLSRGARLDFYSARSSWARECQLQALQEVAEEGDAIAGHHEDDQVQEREAYKLLSETTARRRQNDEAGR